MKRVTILGVSFSKLNMEETLNKLTNVVASDSNKPYHVITANPEIVVGADQDPDLKQITDQADLITPDGIGIVIASRWQGDPVAERVAGYDLLLNLLERGNELGWSFFFLGTSEEANQEATAIIHERYPNLIIAGRHHGFFKDKEAELIEQINEARPDVLVVALGAPRQEQWIFKQKENLHTKIAIGVGGSLDVIAGKVKRAPIFWQKLNLEWFYRLVMQPTRWKRQLALPKFAIKAYFEAKRK
ncbi:N-acetylmannosaminyltransferase [Ammoniphilus oxalaticus]|uniref:N-acetylglucosaminyldiphosphoundecaprenol N-acetyl-beta-D-mannosaminyltransferase n=1 Tax=Ammoniphilus oxalaticus TaxID=66863 RepID=A0A419SFD2_9BACL|nr:WecB/TagA/CpsF family glycosyltransferase [Ammoniphilus oxalaticus]RKD22078.1 N-acetylmannosaminyltransferase [Ammoniphilus oxalaticus]